MIHCFIKAKGSEKRRGRGFEESEKRRGRGFEESRVQVVLLEYFSKQKRQGVEGLRISQPEKRNKPDKPEKPEGG